jgi:hypothetical protein
MRRCPEPSRCWLKKTIALRPDGTPNFERSNDKGTGIGNSSKDMASASNHSNKSTASEDGSWLLVNTTSTSSEVSYVPGDAGSSSQHYIITPQRNHPRSPRAEADPDQPQPSQATRGTPSTTIRTSEAHNAARAELTPPPSPSTAAQTGSMSRRQGDDGSPEGSTSASRQPSSAGAAWAGRGEASGARRRNRAGSSAQEVPSSSMAVTIGSSGSARRREPSGGGPATRYASASGAGSSSSAERAGAGGSGLTERNVSQVSEFYGRMRRERDREGESERRQSRAAFTRAELEKIQGKLREGG